MKSYVFLCLTCLTLMSCTSQGTSQTSKPKTKGYANVYVLSGQSNMEGNTKHDPYFKNYCDDAGLDYEKYVDGFDDFKISYYNHYSNAVHSYSNDEEPMKGQFVNVKLGQGITPECFGPELGLVDALEDQNLSKNPIFLIKYCSGGTAFHNMSRDGITNYNWLSESDGGPGYLYSGLVEFIRNNINLISEMGYVPNICGILWAQGESDSDYTESNAKAYRSHLEKFVGDLREEFADITEDIPFIDSEINEYNSLWVYSKAVNECKQQFASESEYNYLIDTNTGTNRMYINNDEHGGGDIYHNTADSMFRFGRMFGQTILDNYLY